MSEKEKKQEEHGEGEVLFFSCSTGLKWEEEEIASWAILGHSFQNKIL